MSQPSPLRFFRVALQQPAPGMLLFLLLLFSGAVWAAGHDVDEFDQICLVALFFQMFASATGFRLEAQRGHFDPMLLSGRSRLACARAHWLLSAAPGFAAWLSLGAIAWWFALDRLHALLSPSALIAVVYVSTLSWTITLPFSRYAGAVAWLVLIFTLAAGHELHVLREAFMMSSGSWPDTLWRTSAVLTAPVFLVADPDVAGPFTLGAVGTITAASWMAGALFIARFDGVLRDPS